MNKFVGLILVGMLAFAGCSKVPTVEIGAAEIAVSNLVVAGAVEYAPEALASSQNALAQVKAEVEVQNEKFTLFRSYKNTTVLALEAKKIADAALVTTEANKAEAKHIAEVAIADVKSAIVKAKSSIDAAPRGKGSEIDLAMIAADVAGIEQMLVDVEVVFANGKYNEAYTKATAALGSANAIILDLNPTMPASPDKPHGR